MTRSLCVRSAKMSSGRPPTKSTGVPLNSGPMPITTRNGGAGDDEPHDKEAVCSTEVKYKGGAQEMYVTYDLHQKTRGAQSALYHKVRRVYIAGGVTNWRRTGQVRKRTGREVHGLRIEYEQNRRSYRR